MSFLTDTDLEKIISHDINCQDNDKLVIAPFNENSMTPIGYDLRVGEEFLVKGKKVVNRASKNKPIILPPNSTTLITTLEYIQMPRNRLYAGLIESKVSKVCQGLSHISTTIDPDWHGNLLIAVHNHSSEKIELKHEERFCTIVFVKNETVPTKTSKHVGGRGDIMNREFSAISNEEKVREFLHNSISPIIILLFSTYGYLKVDNSPTFFPAMIALGSALALYASKYFQK